MDRRDFFKTSLVTGAELLASYTVLVNLIGKAEEGRGGFASEQPSDVL